MHACIALASPWPALRLWQIDLGQAPPPGALDRLSAPEHARAARFVFEHDRQRYLRAHAALHALLAAALAPLGHAGPIRFDTGPWGKPCVRGAPALHFNLSHSGPLALVALCAHAPVGVDVEMHRPVPDADALAQAHFSARECGALRTAPRQTRDLAFLRCWTRKEAVAKALGTGLDMDLRALEVGVDAGMALVRTPAEGLQLASFELPQGAVASVAWPAGRVRAGRSIEEEEETTA